MRVRTLRAHSCPPVCASSGHGADADDEQGRPGKISGLEGNFCADAHIGLFGHSACWASAARQHNNNAPLPRTSLAPPCVQSQRELMEPACRLHGPHSRRRWRVGGRWQAGARVKPSVRLHLQHRHHSALRTRAFVSALRPSACPQPCTGTPRSSRGLCATPPAICDRSCPHPAVRPRTTVLSSPHRLASRVPRSELGVDLSAHARGGRRRPATDDAMRYASRDAPLRDLTSLTHLPSTRSRTGRSET